MHFRAQNTFKFKFSENHQNVSKERITLTSKDDGENRLDVVDTQFSDPLTSKVAGVCEELSSQNNHKFYSSDASLSDSQEPSLGSPCALFRPAMRLASEHFASTFLPNSLFLFPHHVW